MRIEKTEIKELQEVDRIDLGKITKDLSHVRSDVLQLAVAAFKRNLTTAQTLVALPYLLLSYALGYGAGVTSGVFTDLVSEEERGKIMRRLGVPPQDQLDQTILTMLESLVHNRPFFQSSVRSLLLSTISVSWTTFETLAADSWEAILNAWPIPLGQRSFSNLPPGPWDDLSRKHISVGLLARHGFDLRNRVGTVLKSRFDFTNSSGIRLAFRASFGEAEDLKMALENPNLSRLEASRHVIVHRGGIVDEEFRNRTGTSAPVGAPFPFEGDTVARYLLAAAECGTKLLSACDNWLTHNPPSPDVST